MAKYFFTIFSLVFFLSVEAQNKEEEKKLHFTSDFRFRVEHDWKSKKTDGTYRTDRSRLRYRLRFGFNYKTNEDYSFGARVRTGRLDDQQGPHTTLGAGSGEFGLVQIGLEKLYFQINKGWGKLWVGKNSFPFYKMNELFWNDNVFPEGIALRAKWSVNSALMQDVEVKMGHFIIASQGEGFSEDRYFQGFQVCTKHFEKFKLFPGFYYFHDLSNVPDGRGSYNLDYSIVHLGGEVKLLDKPKLVVGFDSYNNLQNLGANDSIPEILRNQKGAQVFTAKLGQVEHKGQWLLALYLARVQQYAIVDYFAQNDWVRWDYSSFGASGSRISNFQGLELRIGYALEDKANLILRLYSVEQLVSEGVSKETGNRVRLDFNIGF